MCILSYNMMLRVHHLLLYMHTSVHGGPNQNIKRLMFNMLNIEKTICDKINYKQNTQLIYDTKQNTIYK